MNTVTAPTAGGRIGGGVGAIVGGLVGGALGGFLGPGGVLAGRAIGARVGRYGGAFTGAAIADMMANANEGAEDGEEKPAEGATNEVPCVGNCGQEPEPDDEEPEDPQEQANRLHDDVERFRGQDYEDVEQELDRVLRDKAGWSKDPLTRGDGVKYTSPDGKRQIRLNQGYPHGSSRGASDPIHSGPYAIRPSTGTRVPLAGNPALQPGV